MKISSISQVFINNVLLLLEGSCSHKYRVIMSSVHISHSTSTPQVQQSTVTNTTA